MKDMEVVYKMQWAIVALAAIGLFFAVRSPPASSCTFSYV